MGNHTTKLLGYYKKSTYEKMDIDKICALTFDENDEKYLRDLLQKLIKSNFIIENNNEINQKVNIKKVYFNMTYRCNLMCKHCCVEAKHVSEFHKEDEMNCDEIRSTVDKIVKLNPDVLVLSGGEPMIRDDFFEVLQYIRNKYTNKICLSTNATLITKENIEVLSKCVDRFDISLDGIDEDGCSKVRGAGVFDKKMTDKIEEIEVKGQGCWDDCEIWKNNTTAGNNKCRRDFTAYNNPFK